MRAKKRHIGPLPGNLREILFEYQKIGNTLRVSAIDPDSGTEIAMIADPRTSEVEIQRLAARKLAYAIAKKNE